MNWLHANCNMIAPNQALPVLNLILSNAITACHPNWVVGPSHHYYNLEAKNLKPQFRTTARVLSLIWTVDTFSLKSSTKSVCIRAVLYWSVCTIIKVIDYHDGFKIVKIDESLHKTPAVEFKFMIYGIGAFNDDDIEYQYVLKNLLNQVFFL